VFSIAGHAGDWRAGRVPERAAALNQRLLAFQTEAHAGKNGRMVSLLSLTGSDDQITVQALKKAEDSDEIVLRVQERYGRPGKTLIKFAAPVTAVREINAAEEEAGAFGGGKSLSIELKPYQPRTFAVRLQSRGQGHINATTVDLPFNLDGVSVDNDRSNGDFDGKHQTFTAEQFPRELLLNGIPFKFGPSALSKANVLVPQGEQLRLPPGIYNRMYLVAAAIDGDQEAKFRVAANEKSIIVREWQGPIGQWDSRLKSPRQLREVHVAPMTRGQTWAAEAIQADLVVSYDPVTGNVTGIDQIRPGFVKRDEVAYVGTHRHAPDGNQAYIPTYLFLYAIDLPPGLHQVQLPNNDKVRILAVTVVHDRYRLWPATLLYAADLAEPTGHVK
jgi:alpha-mannosidase